VSDSNGSIEEDEERNGCSDRARGEAECHSVNETAYCQNDQVQNEEGALPSLDMGSVTAEYAKDLEGLKRQARGQVDAGKVTRIYGGARFAAVALFPIRNAKYSLDMENRIELTALNPSRAIEASKMRPLRIWTR
jgi:hypothetical protein